LHWYFLDMTHGFGWFPESISSDGILRQSCLHFIDFAIWNAKRGPCITEDSLQQYSIRPFEMVAVLSAWDICCILHCTGWNFFLACLICTAVEAGRYDWQPATPPDCCNVSDFCWSLHDAW
jgi:hypothetical protein